MQIISYSFIILNHIQINSQFWNLLALKVWLSIFFFFFFFLGGGESVDHASVSLERFKRTINPILTGLFESKFLLGGGVNLTPPPLQISAPKGPIVAKFCMDVKTHLKSIATRKKIAENGLFIILL